MTSPIRMSDAASLALHACALLAKDGQMVQSTRTLAEVLDVSEAHLSKVLQRLSKVGIVQSARGPRGGFLLQKPADRISLLEVYEAIEGPMERSLCLLGKEKCSAKQCILGGALASADRVLREYLTTTKLSDLVDAIGDAT